MLRDMDDFPPPGAENAENGGGRAPACLASVLSSKLKTKVYSGSSLHVSELSFANSGITADS